MQWFLYVWPKMQYWNNSNATKCLDDFSCYHFYDWFSLLFWLIVVVSQCPIIAGLLGPQSNYDTWLAKTRVNHHGHCIHLRKTGFCQNQGLLSWPLYSLEEDRIFCESTWSWWKGDCLTVFLLCQQLIILNDRLVDHFKWKKKHNMFFFIFCTFWDLLLIV